MFSQIQVCAFSLTLTFVCRWMLIYEFESEFKPGLIGDH